MTMLSNERSIVVGVDGSERARMALKWAADEACMRDAVLRVVCAGTPHSEPGEFTATFDVFHLTAAGKVAEEAAGLVATRQPTVTVRVETPAGPPAEALLEAAGTAELLVVGARGAGGFLGLRLGSVSRHCLHRATCPLVVVHADPVDPTELRSDRIVVGVDGSEGSDAALHWALDEARRRGASVAAVFAWQYAPVGSYVPPPRLGYEEEAQRIVDTARARAGQWAPDVAVEATHCVGPAVPVLVDEGRRADLLVLGRHGRSHLQELLVGSTAYECADHAHCPVVVIPQAAAEGDRDRSAAGRDAVAAG
ncbi:MAG TPA: universal stress protein [Acidimicrobiales bacterium]|nr:universal stress protein [Acidimicrobiales bacterium]